MRIKLILNEENLKSGGNPNRYESRKFIVARVDELSKNSKSFWEIDYLKKYRDDQWALIRKYNDSHDPQVFDTLEAALEHISRFSVQRRINPQNRRASYPEPLFVNGVRYRNSYQRSLRKDREESASGEANIGSSVDRRYVDFLDNMNEGNKNK
jgi:hypothetical protein